MCISVKVLVHTGLQQVPWDEQRQTLSWRIFSVSCSVVDVKEDFHWNTGHSCIFWLCPKYSGTCQKKFAKKKLSARTTSGQKLLGQFFSSGQGT